MARMLRGEIRWADINPVRGSEQKRSWVKISQIRTLAVERIVRRIARASDEELDEIVEGLNEIVAGS